MNLFVFSFKLIYEVNSHGELTSIQSILIIHFYTGPNNKPIASSLKMYKIFSSMNQLREEVAAADELKKKKEVNEAAYGYGGKFGVQEDR